jgi:DDE superfamily endonuclease
MGIVHSFERLLQVFLLAMTEPTAATFRQLIAGWVFAPRRSLLGMVRTTGALRHHAAFHRVFSAAKWSLDEVGLRLFDLIVRLAPQETVFLVGDDTLISRRGLKIFGAGMHRDPCLSSRSHTVTRWGHCWVVLVVVIESPRTPGRYFALPVLARLYLNKQAAAKWRRKYRSKTELMIEMLQRIEGHATGKALHFLGDCSYTAPAVLARLPERIDVTGRADLDARLHAAPPPRRAGRRGRPPVRGERLPSPRQLLEQTGIRRRKLSLYQGRPYHVRVAESTARFFRTPGRAVKVVAVEHLRGGRGQEVFYSTATDASADQIMLWFSRRWPIEVTFHDAKQHLGIGEPQNRTRQAARRTAASGFLLYSLVTLWHECIRPEPAVSLREWRGKQAPSFADMLAALRSDTLQQFTHQHLSTPAVPPALQKILQPLEYILQLAA